MVIQLKHSVMMTGQNDWNLEDRAKWLKFAVKMFTSYFLSSIKLITDNLSLPGVLAAQVLNFWSGQLHRGGAWMVQLCPSKYPPPIWHLVLGVQSQPALSFTMNHFLVKRGWRIMQENETPCSQTSNAFIACSTYCQLTSLWMRLQTCACETPCCLMSRDLKFDCSYNLSSRYSKKSNFSRCWG